MSEINLLKQYIKSLQGENQTKNQQRQTLYQRINQLNSQNQKLILEINQAKHSHHVHPNAQFQIQQMNQHIQFLQNQLNNLVRLLQEKDGYINNILYQQEKDSQRIIDLQKIVKEAKKNEAKLKEDFNNLKEEYNRVSQQLQQLSQSENNQVKINQLIENYDKIEQLAKEKDVQNQYLKQDNQMLIEEVQELKRVLMQKANQINTLKKSRRKGQQQNQLFKQKSEKDQILTNMDLIRQNNKLIQRVTELEKQKNLLYIQAFENGRGGKIEHQAPATLSPLKIISSRSNASHKSSANKLRMKIEALKQQNQVLLQSLRI